MSSMFFSHFTKFAVIFLSITGLATALGMPGNSSDLQTKKGTGERGGMGRDVGSSSPSTPGSLASPVRQEQSTLRNQTMPEQPDQADNQRAPATNITNSSNANEVMPARSITNATNSMNNTTPVYTTGGEQSISKNQTTPKQFDEDEVIPARSITNATSSMNNTTPLYTTGGEQSTSKNQTMPKQFDEEADEILPATNTNATSAMNNTRPLNITGNTTDVMSFPGENNTTSAVQTKGKAPVNGDQAMMNARWMLAALVGLTVLL